MIMKYKITHYRLFIAVCRLQFRLIVAAQHGSHRGLSATVDKYMVVGLNKVYHTIIAYSCMCLKVITHLGQTECSWPLVSGRDHSNS